MLAQIKYIIEGNLSDNTSHALELVLIGHQVLRKRGGNNVPNVIDKIYLMISRHSFYVQCHMPNRNGQCSSKVCSVLGRIFEYLQVG